MLHIYNSVESSEAVIRSMIHHVLSTGQDLIITGGSKLSVVPTMKGERPIERLMRQTPVNLIVYYSGVTVT